MSAGLQGYDLTAYQSQHGVSIVAPGGQTVGALGGFIASGGHSAYTSYLGLGADQVLVLVSGKRRHTSALVNVNGSIGRGQAAVDLNAIPAASIERIEVLRDGAAAQYGSDAIGGVINVILKQDAPGSLSATVGQVNSSLTAPPLGVLRYNDGGVVQLDATGTPAGSVFAMSAGDALVVHQP